MGPSRTLFIPFCQLNAAVQLHEKKKPTPELAWHLLVPMRRILDHRTNLVSRTVYLTPCENDITFRPNGEPEPKDEGVDDGVAEPDGIRDHVAGEELEDDFFQSFMLCMMVWWSACRTD